MCEWTVWTNKPKSDILMVVLDFKLTTRTFPMGVQEPHEQAVLHSAVRYVLPRLCDCIRSRLVTQPSTLGACALGARSPWCSDAPCIGALVPQSLCALAPSVLRHSCIGASVLKRTLYRCLGSSVPQCCGAPDTPCPSGFRGEEVPDGHSQSHPPVCLAGRLVYHCGLKGQVFFRLYSSRTQEISVSELQALSVHSACIRIWDDVHEPHFPP
ncbi:UNVERIFIED_CONTAM: hypothetical protein FKN15_040856 [Acipenser sinensis]